MENNQKELVLLKDLGMLYFTEKSKRKYRFGLYKCYCGNEFKAMMQNVKDKRTESCGCKKKNILNIKLYGAWQNMVRRCHNKKEKAFTYYGCRGITVCDEWKNDFMSFYDWSISNGWKEGLSIDRKDNDLGYSPDNCRWATKSTQTRNTRLLRKDNTSGYRGVYWDNKKNKYITQIKVNSKKIHIGTFNTAIEAALAYDQYVINNNLEHTKNFS